MAMLKKFADTILIRENEYLHVLYFFLIYLLAGCGNTFGRSSTDALFFKRYGIEYLPTMYIILGVSLSLLSIFYASFADRLKPERFFTILYTLLIGILIVTWAIMTFGSLDYIYPVYFIVYEVASEVFIVHSAFYLGQNFTSMQAKRLFPIIMSGALIGNIIGGTIISIVSKMIGIQNIILLWCVLMSIAITLITLWHKKHGSSPFYRAQHKSSKKLQQAINQITLGVRLLNSSNLLRFMSLSLFFMVITFYVLCYSVNRIYSTTFITEESLTGFYGKLTAATSFIALFFQIFVTNKVIHKVGVKNVNLLFPLTSIVSYVALLGSFSFLPALVGSLNKDSIMPAFRNPVRSMFFHAIPENFRGRALSMQLVIVLPLALALCGTLLIFMQKMGEPVYFLMIGVSAACCYLFFNKKMNNSYVAELIGNMKQRFILPDEEYNSADKMKIDPLKFAEKIEEIDNSSLISFAKIAMKTDPESMMETLFAKSIDAPPAVRDQIVSIISSSNHSGLSNYLWKSYDKSDDHLKHTILTTLFKINDPEAKRLIPKLLISNSLRLQSAGIIGAISTDNKMLVEQAIKTWRELLQSEDENKHFIALKLVPFTNDNRVPKEIIKLYKNNIINYKPDKINHVIEETLSALKYWPEQEFDEIYPLLETIYRDGTDKNKIDCIKCCRLLSKPINNSIIEMAIEDKNEAISYEAAKHLYRHMDNANEQFVSWLTNSCIGSPHKQDALIKVLLTKELDMSIYEKIAYRKAEEALEFYRIQHELSSTDISSPAMKITQYALEERIQEYIDLSLLSMRAIEHPDDIYTIRAGLKSKDSRHIANANEIINNLKSKKIIEILSALIDNSARRISSYHKNKNIKGINDALTWCKNHNDPWIRYCAQNI